MNKIKIGVALMVVAIVGILLAGGFTSNNEETWTIIQRPFSFAGEQIAVENSKRVFIPKCFGTEATYADVYTVFYSDRPKEGGADDESIEVIFSDKGRADFSAQVVFSTPILKEEQINFHKMARGQQSVIIQTVKTALNQASRFTAQKMTASEFFEDQQSVIISIKDLLAEDTLLNTKWNIIIDDVKISNINPDALTKKLFATQQEAVLLGKQAKMNKIKFEQQKFETKADYAQKIEVEKGKAEMIAMKMRTDAEREKELAEIEASKRVAVAELAKVEADEVKQRAEIEANQLLEVAKLERLAAVEQSGSMKLIADAREYELQKGGAISERDKVLAEINAKRDAMVAAELSKIKVPHVVMSGGGEGGGDLTSSMFNMKLMESLGILDMKKVSSTN